MHLFTHMTCSTVINIVRGQGEAAKHGVFLAPAILGATPRKAAIRIQLNRVVIRKGGLYQTNKSPSETGLYSFSAK